MRHKDCGKPIHEDWEHAEVMATPSGGRKVPRLFCECGEEIISEDQIEER